MLENVKPNKINLSEDQLKALPFFLIHTEVKPLCKAIGVCEQTYYRWMLEPEFKSSVVDLRNSVIENAVDRLKINLDEASKELIRLLKEEKNVKLKLKIIDMMFNNVYRFNEMIGLQQQINEIRANLPCATSQPK